MRSENEPDGQEGIFSFIQNARRQQIKAAAIETIVEVGYANASLARIAKRAGVSKGVISYHFAGKDELMEKLVTEFYLAGAHFMIPRMEQQQTARGLLRTYVESNVEYIAANRNGILAVGDIIVNFRDATGKLRFQDNSEGENQLVGAVAQILRDGQESGEFGDFDPWVVATVIRAAIDRASVELGGNPDMDAGRYGRELAELFDRATRKGAT